MVFEDGFCFLLRASPPNGGFFFNLFLVVKDRALPTYLTYVVTTNQHIYSSPTHSRHSFIILAFSYTFTVLILGFLSLSPHSLRKRCGSFHSYKCGGQISLSCVCSAPSLSSYH